MCTKLGISLPCPLSSLMTKCEYTVISVSPAWPMKRTKSVVMTHAMNHESCHEICCDVNQGPADCKSESGKKCSHLSGMIKETCQTTNDNGSWWIIDLSNNTLMDRQTFARWLETQRCIVVLWNLELWLVKTLQVNQSVSKIFNLCSKTDGSQLCLLHEIRNFKNNVKSC